MSPSPVRLAAVVGTALAVSASALVAVVGTASAQTAPLPLPVAGATSTSTPTATSTPSATATATSSPSATATATATPTCRVQLPVGPCLAPPGGSGSASPTATTSPSPTAAPVVPPTIRVAPGTITAVQQSATVSGTAEPGSKLEVYAYSRPSTTYRLVRSTTVGSDGRYAFQVGPSGNTRLYSRAVTDAGEALSESIVLTVRTSLNLKVTRTGTRTYRFSGSLLPKRPGQLVTVFYETGGKRTIVGRARNAADGTYVLNRTFTGTGSFTFFTGTGTDMNNAGNTSNLVRATVR